MKQRLLYPDICKFIAIFLVTWSHCSQCISGSTWNNFLGGSQLDIAFNMPLFMLISGWFINIDKLRTTNIRTYIISKFKRLAVPSIVWFLLHSLLFAQIPDFSISGFYWYFLSLLNYYWYLNALFVCLCIVFISAKLIKNNPACIAVSTLFVLACPLTDIANINFMFPFIWAGYVLRQLLKTKHAPHFIAACAIVGISLCFFWKAEYTVYLSPLKPLHFNLAMATAYIYRFTIGFCLSAVIVYFIMKYEDTCIKSLAPLGQYSLAIYTVSIAMLSVFACMLNNADLHTNQPVVLDILSLALCTVIVCFTIGFTILCRKNKWTSLFFLGKS